MASSPEFMQSVAARLEGAGTITYRKMFGEYCVYCDGKLFGCVTSVNPSYRTGNRYGGLTSFRSRP